MTLNSGAAHFQLFATDGAADIRWRLLSGNNRELGRAVSAQPDVEACLLGIKEMVTGLDDLVGQVRRHEGNIWRWTLAEAGSALIISGSYDRQVRCEQALAHFRVVAPTARPASGVMLSGSRRWMHAAAGRNPLQLGSVAERSRPSQRRASP